MSVEATGWAFRQRIPVKPKMVLMALADQTDERTGRVSYGKTDIAHLADKSSIPERSLFRYIGALVRNGYVIRESGKEKGQASLYWLCLDRPLAQNLDEWQWNIVLADDDDAQDVDEGSANLADPPPVENPDGGLPSNGTPGLPMVADQESSEEPKNIKTVSWERKVSGFSRKAQDTEIEQGRFERAAAKEGSRAFVLEGSRAWIAWCDYRRRHGQVPSLPITTALIEGRSRHGWYMPTLFPPDEPELRSTGPPTQPESLMTEDDHAVMAGEKW